MAETKTKPALTAEEWAVLRSIPWWPEGSSQKHATAARCLYGQPFGFTREDVEALRAASEVPRECGDFNDLADRLEALLPPEEPSDG